MNRNGQDSPVDGLIPLARPRDRSWVWPGGLVLLAVLLANHVEYRFRQRRLQATGDAIVALRQEGELLSGHNSIGIDEAGLATDGFLRFSTLAEWEFDPKSPSPCPPVVKAWHGHEVTCVGFMYPLEPGTKFKTFCLLRTTQTCCYGPRPQHNQYLLVEMEKPLKFERLRPVLVRGRFFADPQPAQGFIYRLEGTSCTPAGADEPDADPTKSARTAGLPLFDFSALAAVKTLDGKNIPLELLAMDGKQVVVAGFFLDRNAGPPPRLLLGRDWWDGASKGVRPTLATAFPVYPRHAGELPPLWKEQGLMTGVLRLERDPQRWAEGGMVSLQDAVRGVPGVTGTGVRVDRGPFLESWHEGLLLFGFVYLAWHSRRRPAANCAAS